MKTRTILGAACMILVLSGCKQEQGESCQIDDDCTGSLICCKSNPYAIETDRGVCLTQEECDTRDASTDPGTDEREDASDDPVDDGEDVTDPLPDPVDDPADDPAVETVEDPGTDDAPEDVSDDETTD